MRLSGFLSALLVFTWSADAAKILFISPPLTPSLLLTNGRIADVLVQNGHDVTMWIPEMTPCSINGTKLAKVVRMDNVSDSWTRVADAMGKADMLEDSHMSAYEEQSFIWSAFVEWCDGKCSFLPVRKARPEHLALLYQRERFEWIRQEKFDLVITDDPYLCIVGLVHYLGIPRHIWFATGPLHEINNRMMGIPPMLSFVPVLESAQLVGPVTTFTDRLRNLYSYVVGAIVQGRVANEITAVYRKHISPTFPDVAELASKAALCFVNSDEFIDIARPVLHKTVYIGGIGFKAPKPLPEDIDKAMSKGKKGVVYMSFGSFAPTEYMNAKKKNELFKAFAELQDYHFIVKISANDDSSRELVQGIGNIEPVDWFPQIDALGHPRMRLFITHGGYNSLMESAIRGVPMVAIPLFFDQFRDAMAIEYKGFGRCLERSKLNKDYIVGMLTDVLENPSYKANAMTLSKLFWSKPFKPEETLVKWTNFVLENDNLSQLIPEGVHQSVLVYYSLDIYAFLLASLIGIVIVFSFALSFLYSCAVGGKIKTD